MANLTLPAPRPSDECADLKAWYDYGTTLSPLDDESAEHAYELFLTDDVVKAPYARATVAGRIGYPLEEVERRWGK